MYVLLAGCIVRFFFCILPFGGSGLVWFGIVFWGGGWGGGAMVDDATPCQGHEAPDPWLIDTFAKRVVRVGCILVYLHWFWRYCTADLVECLLACLLARLRECFVCLGSRSPFLRGVSLTIQTRFLHACFSSCERLLQSYSK